VDETERRILELLRDLEAVPSTDPEITVSAGFIHLRRDGRDLATDIPASTSLDGLLAYGWVAETSHGHFRITSAGLRAIGVRH
jgi:hypothetical protein